MILKIRYKNVYKRLQTSTFECNQLITEYRKITTVHLLHRSNTQSRVLKK